MIYNLDGKGRGINAERKKEIGKFCQNDLPAGPVRPHREALPADCAPACPRRGPLNYMPYGKNRFSDINAIFAYLLKTKV
jgi:hypothetical protein